MDVRDEKQFKKRKTGGGNAGFVKDDLFSWRELPPKGAPADPQPFGRPALVHILLAEHKGENLLFHLFQRFAEIDAAIRAETGLLLENGTNGSGGNIAALRREDQGMDGPAKLPQIAGPGEVFQKTEGLGLKAGDLPPQLPVTFVEQKAANTADVLPALSQGGQAEDETTEHFI